MLSKVRHYFPPSELRSIFHAIFSSHMKYGCQIWGQDSINTRTIQKLQDSALRIINFQNFRDSANPLYIKEQVLKLDDEVKMQNCLLLYDFIHGQLPGCFDSRFFTLNHVYYEIRTRGAGNCCFFKPLKNTTRYGLNSLSYKSIYMWNKISTELNMDLSSLSKYKLKNVLRTYFLDTYT